MFEVWEDDVQAEKEFGYSLWWVFLLVKVKVEDDNLFMVERWCKVVSSNVGVQWQIVWVTLSLMLIVVSSLDRVWCVR